MGTRLPTLHAISVMSGKPAEQQKEASRATHLLVFSSSPRLQFNEFLKGFCAATTSLDHRPDGGVVDRHRSARFQHQLQDPAAALLCCTHLCPVVVLR